MKRMNIIRVAVFAVVTFMGTVSLSAQTWDSPQTALNDIQTALNGLTAPPTKTGQQPGQLSGAGGNGGVKVSPNTVNDVVAINLKSAFLIAVANKIKSGIAVGDAVNAVYAEFQQLPGYDSNNRQSRVQTTYDYVVGLLSN